MAKFLNERLDPNEMEALCIVLHAAKVQARSTTSTEEEKKIMAAVDCLREGLLDPITAPLDIDTGLDPDPAIEPLAEGMSN